MPNLTRNGGISCGGATRLLPTQDTTIALALSRPSDIDLLPAFLGASPSGSDTTERETAELTSHFDSEVADASRETVWQLVTDIVATEPAAVWIEQAALLGLAASALSEIAPPTVEHPAVQTMVNNAVRPALRATDSARRSATSVVKPVLKPVVKPVVVDFSSLWAGPLCTRVLKSAGMTVTKVEDLNRPDGARTGSPEFFAELHDGKEFAQFDFFSEAGRTSLRTLVDSADIVIEGSRPRALAALGIDADAWLRGGGARVWTSITGHGRSGTLADRVAFGDDAAVAGGLVHRQGSSVHFFGDAVADPLTGLVAAVATLLLWQHLASAKNDQPNVLLDIAMSRVAASFAGRFELSPAAGRL